MNPPTVCLVTQQARWVRSGVGTYARVLLDDLARRDLGIAVATWSDEIAATDFPSVRWIDLGKRPLLDPTPGGFYTLARRAARVLRDQSWALVHFLDAREACVLVRQDRPFPLLGTVHDDYAARAPRAPWGFCGRAADPWRRWLYYRMLARLERRCYPRLNLLMANSRETGRSLVEVYRIPETNIRHVPLGVSPTVNERTAEILPGRPALLFAGGNFYRKGLDVVLKSLPALVPRLPELQLHVVGGDRAEKRLRALARRLGVGAHVTFYGRVAAPRMAAMVAGADMFVMPSRREALGLVYLEAFRASVPVVAGSEGGVQELVRHRETGLVVPPEDPRALKEAVLAIHEDEALRVRLQEGGRRVCEARTPEVLLAATLRTYVEAAPTLADWVTTSRPSEGSPAGSQSEAVTSERT